MKIMFNQNVQPQKNAKNPAFGQRYHYDTIMAIMSDSYLVGREDAVNKTVASLLQTTVKKNIANRAKDFERAKGFLRIFRQDLIPAAERFRQALDEISVNHMQITSSDRRLVTQREMKKFGPMYINID